VGEHREGWTGQPSPLQTQNTKQNLNTRHKFTCFIKNPFFRLTRLRQRDRLQGRGPSLRPPHLRFPPLCPRPPHPPAGQSSYPSRFGEETGVKTVKPLLIRAQEVSVNSGHDANHSAENKCKSVGDIGVN